MASTEGPRGSEPQLNLTPEGAGGGAAVASGSGSSGTPSAGASAGGSSPASGATLAGATLAGASVAGASASKSLLGRRVKRFRLIDELGAGAMGRVYIAEDTIIKRHVALKLLPARHRDGRPNHRTERLIREARSVASLEHPNVVAVYEIDQAGSVHYIAMELVEGGNLERLVQMSGPMEIERACQLCAEAAEALSHAHKRGIIHRDIKPANLLLTRAGRCKVADFGLACFDDRDDAEMRAKCVGTPNFIPPEIAEGKGATEASDVYSLGCTLWFLLTGRPPFVAGNSRDVLKMHVSQPLGDLRRFRPEATDRLLQALQQACAKDPTQRPTAEQFAAVLRTLTIPTVSAAGSSAYVPMVTVSPSKSHGATQALGMQPVGASATNLSSTSGPSAGSFPSAAAETSPPVSKKASLPAPMVWAGVGIVAAAVLIALGVWLARPGPDRAQASAGQGAAPAPGAPAASAPVTPAEVKATPAEAVKAASPSAAPTSAPIDDKDNIVVNGGLDPGEGKGGLLGWGINAKTRPKVQVLEEKGNYFVRFTNDDEEGDYYIEQSIPVDPAWKNFTASARFRLRDYKAGWGSKDGARVILSFRDDDGKRTDSSVGAPNAPKEAVVDWTERSVTKPVPPKSTSLHVLISFRRGTGVVDFDDIRVVATK